MAYAYNELAGAASPTETNLDFVAFKVRIRYISGSVTCSIGFGASGDTVVFAKLDPLASGLQGTHPHEIQIDFPSGFSKVWNQTNSTTISIVAWA
jgi:hypothetical protein